jgi:heptosyltransferase-2
LFGGENREKGWTGMAHLPREIREKPGSERGFLAGKTERNFLFANTNWDTRTAFITDLEILTRIFGSLTRIGEGNTIDGMKIVVRAPNWIGDTILCLPALTSLKKNYPDAEIWVAASAWTEGIFAPLDWIRGILSLSNRNSLKSVAMDAHKLKEYGFDIGILFTNSFGSALLFFLAKIPHRWGYARDGRHLLITKRVRTHPLESRGHHIQYYLKLLSKLGLENTPALLDYPMKEEEKRQARDLLRSLGVDTHKPIITMSPGAAYGPAKRWPESHFAELAGLLQAHNGAEILLIGTEADTKIAESIASFLKKKPVILTGKTTIPQLAGVIGQSDLFISNDTGPMHLANALKVPVIAMFGPTDPQITGPYQSPSTVFKNDVPCWPCSYRDCPFEHQCMTQVSPSKVYEACQEFLK